MTISIITVSYNAEKTILDTIESVANQSYQHIEFIIIDGGSTDSTLDIINANKSNIDIVVSEPDKGIYDAMNKGVKRATGEWILFLGADDVLHSKDTLTTCSSQLSSRFDLIYGEVVKVPSQIRYDGTFNLFKLIYRNICHQGIFFNKTIFDKLGFYNQKYRINADWEFNIRAFQDPSVKIKFIPVLVSDFFEEGASGHQVDEAYEIRRKELLKTMPIWVKACYKYRRSALVKRISETFLNFKYA